MARLEKGSSITSRREAGDTLLVAAKTTDTVPIAARLAAFTKAHEAYGKADDAVKKAVAAHSAQLAKVGEADVIQDEHVDALANALVGEGLPRANPFKPLGFAAPSKIAALGYAEEADTAEKLMAAVRAKKYAKKETLAALNGLKGAVKEVRAALSPLKGLEKARASALATRGALELPWETSFAALRRAAKAAADDGFLGYSVLFESAPEKPAKKKPKKPSKADDENE